MMCASGCKGQRDPYSWYGVSQVKRRHIHPGDRHEWARLDVVGAAHCCVGELTHKVEPGALGEGGDGLALALIAVFVGPDICR
jgi:hypothetical protein